MEITEKKLSEAAGWKAWKAGRDLVKQHAVSDASNKNGLYTGVLKVGGKPKRTKVTIRSKTDITTVCGCLENRRDGLLCAHGVAVVLAVLQGESGQEDPSEIPIKKVSKGDTLGLLLPPIFVKLLAAEKPIPVRWEKMAQGIPSTVLGLPEFLEKEGGVVALDGAAFQAVLVASCDQPNVLWLDGKEGRKPVSVGSIPFKFPIETVDLEGEKILRINGKSDSSSFSISKGWLIFQSGESIQKLPDASFAADLFPKLQVGKPLRIPLEDFVAEIERWDAHCDFGDQLEGLGLRISDAEIQSRVDIKGGSQALVAECQTQWVDELGQVLVGAKIGSLLRSESDPLQWYRALPGERDAGVELIEYGFVKSGRTYELRGEERVMEFLAFGLVELEQVADVRLKTELAAYRGMLAPLRPEIEFSEGSGQDWTGFDLGYRAPGSDRLSLDQVRKLLQSGRKTVKMKTGQTAVLAASDMESLEQMLKDVDPEQSGGGYRVSPAQASYMREFATSEGLGLRGGREQRDQADLKFTIPELFDILRDYQREGVRFLVNCLSRTGAALLADDMGLGKTLQSLAVMATLRAQGKEGPFLVVGPTSLVSSWMSEVETFLPQWRAQAYHGAGRKAGAAEWPELDVVVTSFALVARDLSALKEQKWAGIFVDEASIMRNPDTQSAKALCALESEARVALTGTPIENGVGDIWSIFRFLLPRYLGPRKDFKERYEKPVTNGVADRSTMSRLRARLAPFMLRRLKSDVAKDLPSKIITVRDCEMSSAQSDVYHSLLKDGQQVLEEFGQGGAEARMQVLTLLLRLRQAATDPRLLGMKKDGPSGKMEHLQDLLSEALAGGHKVLVFSQFTSMLDLIGQHLEEQEIPFCLLTGSTRDRGAEVKKFQRRDGPAVFLISLKAGGYGLTLTEADTVIHCDPWWNPAVENQATDRAHRIGQTRPVTVYKLITKGTVEEKILALQEKKQGILDGAFDEASPAMRGLSDDDLMEVLGG